MKKKWQWILFLLCLVTFLTFRIRSIGTKPEAFSSGQLYVPDPSVIKIDPLALLPLPKDHEKTQKHFANIVAHPWIQAQCSVKEISLEMVRDIELLQEVCEYIRQENPALQLSNDQVAMILIQTVMSLQDQIPFSFPEELYNVLCIPQSNPFQIYKRLYLGENELGFPFYLDVRVFELEGTSSEEIITQHFNILQGGEKGFKILYSEEGRKTYQGEGRLLDPPHGFAEIESKRGIYLDCIEQEGRLFVAYAEAPLETFKKCQSIFRDEE